MWVPSLPPCLPPTPARSLMPAVIKVLQLPRFFLPLPRGLLKRPCSSLISSGMTSVMHRPNILHHTWGIIRPPTSSPPSCYNASIHLFYCGKVPKTKELLLVTFGALTMLCNHHHDLVPELFHHPKGESPDTLSGPFSPLPLATTNLLSVSTICLFWTFPINVAFYIWHLFRVLWGFSFFFFLFFLPPHRTCRRSQ